MIAKTIQEIHQWIGGELYINKQTPQTKIQGVCIDSRKIEKGNIYFAIEGDRVDGHLFIAASYGSGASLAIVSNREYIHQDIACILVTDVIETLQILARKYRESLSVKVIGITGSNGKTSCKDLLYSILSNSYKTIKTQGNRNNEIGVPLTLLEMREDCEFAVVEMGMENLEDIHFLNTIVQPDFGIVTNVGIAHLENLGSMDNIGRAKLELVDGLKDSDYFIYNGDDMVLSKIIKEKEIVHLKIQTFGEKNTNTIYLESFHQEAKSITFQTNMFHTSFQVPTLGKHQACNAMAALLLAYDIGLNQEQIQLGFDGFVATGMRNEIQIIGNCTVLNDAYKSNPQSAVAALDTFEGMQSPYKIIVLGDMLDLGPDEMKFHFQLGEQVAQHTYDELLCYGERSKQIIAGAFSKVKDKKYHHFESHNELEEYLREHIKRECALLLKGSRGMTLDKILTKLMGEQDE